MQRYSLFLAICLLTVCSSCTRARDGKTDLGLEEYSVYSALISSEYIFEHTQSLIIADETVSMEWPVDFNKMFESSISQETAADFKDKNRSSYPLSSHFSLSVEYAFVDAPEICKEDCLINHPDADGLVGFSRVGFNYNVDQALVYVVYYCGRLCIEDGFFLLGKEDGTWKVQEKHIMGRS